MSQKAFDFDAPLSRRGTRSLKWDSDRADGIVQLWVADMDFATAPVIRQALEARVAQGIFGYGIPTADFFDAIVSWHKARHGALYRRNDIVPTTGVVPAVSAALQATCLPGDEVIIQTPAYNCFFSSIRNSGARLSANALKLEGNRWTIDFADLERRAASTKARALLFCNPQNPTGRVWTREELLRVEAICRKHRLILISDEIHAEFTAPGHRFIPFASVSDWAAENCVTLSAASKAFNLAGLQCAYIIAGDPVLRNRIDRQVNINEICDAGPLGMEALIAAYSEEGAAWLDALNAYLDGNRALLQRFLAEELPECRMPEMEGTYLAWVDFSAFGLSSSEIERELLLRHRVRIASGATYGETTPGWIRINLATQRARLEEGLRRIALWARERRSQQSAPKARE